jgi:uncharacterized SAM-binding protein YcdF (DUF218 family)
VLTEAMTAVLVIGTATVGAVVLTLRAIDRARSGDPPRRAQAIVVLGAAVRSGRPCPELRARLARAAELWRIGAAPRIVCSGGSAEAIVMCDSLRAEGIPAHALALDSHGVSSRETLRRAPRPGPIILVSSPWHLHRLRSEARRQGSRVHLCPATASPVETWPRARRRQLAREIVAIWAYALVGLVRRLIPGWGPLRLPTARRQAAEGEA